VALRDARLTPAAVLLLGRPGAHRDRLLQDLRTENFDPDSVDNEQDALARIVERPPDVLLVDVSPPGVATRRLCQRLRARTAAPILVFLTEGAADELVDYLDSGADDYLSRPGRHHELIARMRVLLRSRPIRPSQAPTEALRVGDVVLDAERHEVSVGDRPVQLPRKQFQLLELLMANAGQVLPKGNILRRVWSYGERPDSNSLEVQISRLRQSIEDDPAKPRRIRTVRGLGYMYVDQDDPARGAG
jgi:two-component system response regulator RegX3